MHRVLHTYYDSVRSGVQNRKMNSSSCFVRTSRLKRSLTVTNTTFMRSRESLSYANSLPPRSRAQPKCCIPRNVSALKSGKRLWWTDRPH